MNDKETTEKLLDCLRNRHPSAEWASFAELNMGTGRYSGRKIDFYAMHLWPSKGYLKVAYEIKASRSDFRRELQDPEKRSGAEKVANECYFVMPSNIVQFDEIPQGWGLLVLQSDGLKCAKLPTQRKVEQLPEEFIMSLARRMSDKPKMPDDVMAEIVGDRKREIEKLYKLRDVIQREIGLGFDDPEAFRNWIRIQAKPMTKIERELRTLLGHVTMFNRMISSGNENYEG